MMPKDDLLGAESDKVYWQLEKLNQFLEIYFILGRI